MTRLFLVVIIAGLVLLGGQVGPARAAGPDTYVVQPGDTLYAISARYGVSINDLAAANGLGNGVIYAGQQLTIPAAWSPSSPSQFSGGYPVYTGYANAPQNWSNPRPVNQSAGGSDYVVQPGDTLFSLARQQGVRMADLEAANGLSEDGPPIVAGQSLWLPAPAESSLLTRPALSWNDSGWNQPYPGQPTWTANSFTRPVFGVPGAERWIEVDLTHQSLTAFEGQIPVLRTRISSGMGAYPTIVGTFSIYVKYESADMSGGTEDDAYYLPGVPYVMYFSGNYGLHGTYWHNNFGTPMSHGCVNLPTPEAQWLYNWAPLGTKVVIHY